MLHVNMVRKKNNLKKNQTASYASNLICNEPPRPMKNNQWQTKDLRDVNHLLHTRRQSLNWLHHKNIGAGIEICTSALRVLPSGSPWRLLRNSFTVCNTQRSVESKKKIKKMVLIIFFSSPNDSHPCVRF